MRIGFAGTTLGTGPPSDQVCGISSFIECSVNLAAQIRLTLLATDSPG